MSLMELKSGELSLQYNKALDLYKINQQTIKSKKIRFEQLLQRHIMGDPTLNEWAYLEEISDLSKSLIEAEAQKITSIHSYLITKGKLSRLLMKGYYQGLDEVLPRNKK